MIMRLFSVLVICVSLGFFTSCSSDEAPISSLCPTIDEADQTALFEFYKDELIIPAYSQAVSDVQVLKSGLDNFLNDPSTDNLLDVQNQFKTAYLSWEYAEPFYFGPAEDQLIEDHFNYFPIDMENLQLAIQDGFDADLTEKYDRGFPAMDYLLFNGSESEIIETLTQSDVRAYLLANIENMESRIVAVEEAWRGSFGASFVANTGKADGASLSQIINTYNRHFETIKRNRIGLPSGILTLGFKQPQVVEGFYSAMSLELAKASVAASSAYFYGHVGGTDAHRSIYSLLNDLDLLSGNDRLADKMEATITEFIDHLNNIEGTLDYAVEFETEAINELYQSMSGFVVLAKTDMPTALCISITYVDNPSDSD